MIAPPLTVERLLEALGPRTDFRDGVLGDIAEEFALRAERDGSVAARRWYYREAIRTTPHLLRDWARCLHARDVEHLVSAIIASFVLLLVLEVILLRTAFILLAALGVAPALLPPSLGVLYVTAVELALVGMSAITGGFIAAWIGRRTPLVSALAFGVVWLCAVVAGCAVVQNGPPVWYEACAILVMMVGTTIGGILRIRATRLVSREGDSDSLAKRMAC
jgi:hypothetical protein